MPPGALRRALAWLNGPMLDDDPQSEIDRLADVTLPRSVARAGLGRRRWLAPGLWAAPVRTPRTDDWRTFLLRVPANMTVPTHGHRGGELIAVWDGAFQNGGLHVAGDFAENIADSNHQLRVTPAGRCVCVISVQGRIQWRGWAKMITPVLGI